jgi:hypothetical protein
VKSGAWGCVDVGADGIVGVIEGVSAGGLKGVFEGEVFWSGVIVGRFAFGVEGPRLVQAVRRKRSIRSL